MKSIKAHLQQRKPGGGLLGAELAQLTKAATSKSVPEPSEELMLAVVTAVNSSSEASAAQQMRDILHKRLKANNPHKVWLATVLTDKVLKDCADTISPVRSDLYQDLADIAGKPLDRYQENFKDEQRAKMHAFGVLRGSGRQAQSILRHTCKIGRMVSLTLPEDKSRRRAKKDEASDSQTTSHLGSTSGAATTFSGAESDSNINEKMTWEQVEDAVTTSLGVAASHTQMIQDLVLNITSGKSAAPDFERQFLGELVEEVLSFRGAFEQLLSSFSTFKQDTGPLVKKSLEAIEEMNNVLELYQTQVVGEGTSSSAPPPGTLRMVSLSGGVTRSRFAPSDSAVHGGSSSGAPQSATSRSRSGPLENLQAVGEALPTGNSGSGWRDKDRSVAPAIKKSSSLPRSSSGRMEGSAPLRQPGYCPPAIAPQQPTHPPLAQQHSLPFGQQQGSYIQAPQQTYFPEASFYQQQLQQQPHQGSGGSGWGHQMGNSSAMPGFIPMPHSMTGGGAPPVLYMPVTGPNGQQGFAPVFQPQQQHQHPSMFASGSVPQGGGAIEQQGQQQARNAIPQSLPVAVVATQKNPFGPALPSIQPGSNNMAAVSSSSSAAPAVPPRSGPQADSFPNSASSHRAAMHHPLPAVRHRQPPASSSDPFDNIGELDAPYTPAAIAASNSVHAALADGSAPGTPYDSDSDTFPRPLSSSSLCRTPFSHNPNEGSGREGIPAVSSGAIPHSISASSDIFPAETASRVLASAGLPSFPPPPEALPLAEPSVEAAWNPHFPSLDIAANEGRHAPTTASSEAPLNLLI